MPISRHNIRKIAQTVQTDVRDLVNHHSQDADLVILGLCYELLNQVGKGLFLGFDDVGDILFVRASGQKMLVAEKEMGELTPNLG